MTLTDTLRARLLAAGAHLAVSALIAAGVAAVTLGLWYPGAFAEMAGGRRLFLLILGVDVVMGPLLTLVVFDRRKPRGELVRDLAVIAALQLGALAYGLHTLYVARPVALVHEPGRFRVVAANEVQLDDLPNASEAFRQLWLDGPRILGTRPTRPEERLGSLELALKGYDVGQRPSRWRPYAESRETILAESKPVSELLGRHAERQQELRTRLAELNLPPDQARYLPAVARGDWVVLLDGRGDIAGYAPFDGF
ncbi:pilus assembly protein [uncultured Piscinibacter sp.]|uniref:pilus assembly protein n=1 Tax=uncultured Piscinibacter sp. TaxID=1131835 RepID=UPI0026064290|nr:pilus assembly protein [uncultured Piscinibacter sp.]